MIPKAYYYLKKDIKNTRMPLIVMEIIAFILLWAQMYLIYFTNPIDEFFMYLLDLSPIITGIVTIVFSLINFALFIVTSFGMAKIIHEIRMNLHRYKFIKSQRGWIFMDSVFGMVLLSIAIIALVFACTQSIKSTAAASNRTQATYIAQQALEKLKAQDGKEAIDISVVQSPITASNKIVYTIVPEELSVLEIATDTHELGKNLKPYKVTVRWPERGGENTLIMVGYCYVLPKI